MLQCNLLIFTCLNLDKALCALMSQKIYITVALNQTAFCALIYHLPYCNVKCRKYWSFSGVECTWHAPWALHSYWLTYDYRVCSSCTQVHLTFLLTYSRGN